MTLANGTQLLARYTPEIHFRNASGGSWNTNTNWTVGIKPGPPNDTFIDPPSVFSTTVTGPTSDVTIKSLTVAGRNGATAQLNLNGGATVEVLGGVTIGSTVGVAVQSGLLDAGGLVTNSGSLSLSAGAALAAPSLLNSNTVTFSG